MALTWSDIDLELMLVNVRRSCVRNRFGDTKTEASRKPVPPSSLSREDAGRLEARVSLSSRQRLRVPVFAVAWQEAGDAGHDLEEGNSTCARKSRHYGEGHLLA